jgi:hypothetical protein
MRTLAFVLLLALSWGGFARAEPFCSAEDQPTLCELARATRADNPNFAELGAEAPGGAQDRAARHGERRAQARAILDGLAAPTWRDLYRAGYVIAYGDTPEEDLLAHAIAIRALSLAPDEADVRFLVAMTLDELGRRYAGLQVYGRQKIFVRNLATGAWQGCLPHMITPALPTSVGRDFHDPASDLPHCPHIDDD